MTTIQSLKERFETENGISLIINGLMRQLIVGNHQEVAEEIFSFGNLVFLETGTVLLTEGEWTNSLYFILAGKVEVFVKGNKVAERCPNMHVGEMALIDESNPRSATVVAMEPVASIEISERTFSEIANRYPMLWRNIAIEVAERLRERSKFVRQKNSIPTLFIACASESLQIATLFQTELQSSNLNVVIWTDGVFQLSEHTMESLDASLENTDFALAIFSGDDLVTNEERDVNQLAPRDNTIFELGLFSGAIGRLRSFFAVPSDENIKIPSDLIGITSLRYDPKHSSTIKLEAKKILNRIVKMGPR